MELCFSVFRSTSAYMVAKAIINNFIFPTWACDAGFANNNNNKNNHKNHKKEIIFPTG